MNGNTILATSFIILGLILFILSRRGSSGRTVRADSGSVAIGGSNSAPVTVSTSNRGRSEEGNSKHVLTAVAIIVEVAGIVVAFWHHFSPAAAK
jgi:hypothetical protein